MIVTIVHTAGAERFAIISPYEARGVMKTLPGCRWDPHRKVWTFPVANLDVIKELLRRAGIIYDDINEKRSRNTTQPADNAWAVALFTAVGPDLADDVYRALSRILHPDTGGNTQLMAALNSARPKAGAR